MDDGPDSPNIQPAEAVAVGAQPAAAVSYFRLIGFAEFSEWKFLRVMKEKAALASEATELVVVVAEAAEM